MNTPNNKRRKESQAKIERVFLELIQTREIHEVTVTDICKEANVNRTTFYTNYLDVYDLADKIKNRLEQEVAELYAHEREAQTKNYDFLKLFEHIKDNQIFYKTYFKLGFDNNFIVTNSDYKHALKYNIENIEYHIEFFRAGLNAIIKKWLNCNCYETPQEMLEILKSEYDIKLNIDKI